MALLFPVLGSAVAIAGADKLAGNKGYVGMFQHLGWTGEQMRAAAIAETAGGVLMVPRSTRRLGGALVAAVSAAVLLSELSDGETKLAASRALVLLGGLAAMFAPGPTT